MRRLAEALPPPTPSPAIPEGNSLSAQELPTGRADPCRPKLLILVVGDSVPLFLPVTASVQWHGQRGGGIDNQSSD